MSYLTIFDYKVPRNLYEVHRDIYRMLGYPADAERDFLFMLNRGRLIIRTPKKTTDLSLHEDANTGRYSFFVRINAVKRSLKGRNHVPVPDNALQDYLNRQIRGAEVMKLRIADRRMLQFYKNGRLGHILARDIVGELDIYSDKEFQETLTAGIGKARAFGCGMLLFMEMEMV